MAANNVTGAILGTRMGALGCAQAIPFAYTDTTAFKAFTVGASAQKPVYVEVSFATTLTFNAGTTNKVSVGTTSTSNEIVSLFDLATVTTGKTGNLVAPTAQLVGVLTADTDIYVKFVPTGTAASAGTGFVIVKLYTLNSAAI